MPSSPSGPPPELAGLPPSARIGKFLRSTLLGRGGCGDVYKAWDTELNRWVALKFLHGDDETESARLRREAQTAARLNHPNICAVYEVAVHEDRPFIAMQFIDGSVLTHDRDHRRSARFVRDAALAVHYAHQQGVIHRDLKPGNLMLEAGAHEGSPPSRGSSANRPSPREPRVYVMDFGLAKQTSNASSLSVSGLMVGTPAYMPPEQARGQNQAIDARSDVYSLGATLYELVTGRAPFTGTNAVDIALQVVELDPPAPRSFDAALDSDLETIILKCLEKEPERRYATAEELAADLSRWLASEPIFAHAPSTLYRIRKRLRKHSLPVVISIFAVAVIALIGGLALPRMIADRRAREGAERRQAVLQELNRLWSEFLVAREWTRQPFRQPSAVRDARLRALDGIRRFAESHPGLASAWYVRARGCLQQGRLDEAVAAAERALAIDAAFDPARAIASQARLEWYRRAVLEGERPQALALLEEARAGLSALSDPSPERFGLAGCDDDAVTARIWTALTRGIVRQDRAGAVQDLIEAQGRSPSEELCRWIAHLSGSPEEQSKWLDESVRIAPHSLPGRLDRATRAYTTAHYDAMERDADHAIALDPDHAYAFYLRAVARVRLSRIDEALADFDRAIALDPRDASFYTGRGVAHHDRRDLQASLADHTRALELAPDYPFALANRGTIHALLKDREAALSDLDRALALAPAWSGGWAFRGNIKELLGESAAALSDFSKAIDLNPRQFQYYVSRGNNHREAGRLRDALDDYSKAVDLRPDSVDNRTSRGLLRRETGDFRGSLEDFDRAIAISPEDAESWTNRGKTKHAMRDIEGSIDDHTRATELKPAWAVPYYNRALAKAAKGDRDGAIADYTLAIERDKEYVDALSNRGLLRMNAGDREGALQDQVRAVELAPDNPVPRVNLGVVLGNNGDKAGAIVEWERALKLAPLRWPFRTRVEQMIRKAREPSLPQAAAGVLR